MKYVELFCCLLLSILSLSIFIDRLLLSKTGFSSFDSFIFTSIALLLSLTYLFIKFSPNFMNNYSASFLIILLIYHIAAFIIIFASLITIVYIVSAIDYFMKLKLPKLNFKIFTSSHLYYKSLLQNKSFIKFAFVISYFITTLLILFPIPTFILSFFNNESVEFILLSSEIEKYQQLFVFSTVPILFSVLKK